jgi:hypothetical protein
MGLQSGGATKKHPNYELSMGMPDRSPIFYPLLIVRHLRVILGIGSLAELRPR